MPPRNHPIYERNGRDTVGGGSCFPERRFGICASDETSPRELPELCSLGQCRCSSPAIRMSRYTAHLPGCPSRLLRSCSRCEELGVLLVPEEVQHRSLKAECHCWWPQTASTVFVRQKFKDQFRPDLSVRRNKYICTDEAIFHADADFS